MYRWTVHINGSSYIVEKDERYFTGEDIKTLIDKLEMNDMMVSDISWGAPIDHPTIKLSSHSETLNKLDDMKSITIRVKDGGWEWKNTSDSKWEKFMNS